MESTSFENKDFYLQNIEVIEEFHFQVTIAILQASLIRQL